MAWPATFGTHAWKDLHVKIPGKQTNDMKQKCKKKNAEPLHTFWGWLHASPIIPLDGPSWSTTTPTITPTSLLSAIALHARSQRRGQSAGWIRKAHSWWSQGLVSGILLQAGWTGGCGSWTHVSTATVLARDVSEWVAYPHPLVAGELYNPLGFQFQWEASNQSEWIHFLRSYFPCVSIIPHIMEDYGDTWYWYFVMKNIPI